MRKGLKLKRSREHAELLRSELLVETKKKRREYEDVVETTLQLYQMFPIPPYS